MRPLDKDIVFRVIDFETTGMDPSKDRICEVGYADVGLEDDSWKILLYNSQLCNPGNGIPATASAIHHITHRMIRDMPPPADVLRVVVDNEAFVMTAHNAVFDQAFAGQTGWLCTMRLAMHLIPDAPAYKNEVLRYWLGYEELGYTIDDPTNRNNYATHRAGHDAYVTATILCHMLNFVCAARPETTVEGLIALAESPVLLKTVVGFGKYHDLTWDQLPHDYLQWMAKENAKSMREKGEPAWDRDRMYTVTHYLNV